MSTGVEGRRESVLRGEGKKDLEVNHTTIEDTIKSRKRYRSDVTISTKRL